MIWRISRTLDWYISCLVACTIWYGGRCARRALLDCVINDYADRDFDPHVARTKERPLAAGKVTPKEALVVFAVLCLMAFAWVMYLAVMLWALVYDTVYAMVDKDDDLKIGVKSTVILFGAYDRHIMALLQVVILGLLVAAGQMARLGWPYYLGLMAAAGLSVYQQKLIAHRENALCFKAFLNSNWFGLAVFAGILAGYLGRSDG